MFMIYVGGVLILLLYISSLRKIGNLTVSFVIFLFVIFLVFVCSVKGESEQVCLNIKTLNMELFFVIIYFFSLMIYLTFKVDLNYPFRLF